MVGYIIIVGLAVWLVLAGLTVAIIAGGARKPSPRRPMDKAEHPAYNGNKAGPPIAVTIDRPSGKTPDLEASPVSTSFPTLPIMRT